MKEASIVASALYLDRPFFGSRRIAVTLGVDRTRIRRLMRILGIEAHLSETQSQPPSSGSRDLPYLLRGVSIERPNQVWSTDIMYLPMHGGFL
jgi:putative transposase